jgi:hypothetical protein
MRTVPLTIESDDPLAPAVRVPVTGQGTAASAPQMVVDPTALDFGSVAAGQTRDLALTVRNPGTAALQVASIRSSNAHYSATSPAAPFTVNAGAQQTVTVRFSPATAGSETGTLTISPGDSAVAPATLSLRGQGITATADAAAIEVTPGSLAFGNLTLNQTKDLTLTVRSAGTGVLTVSLLQVPLGAFSPFSLVPLPVVPFTLPAGASQTVTVRFSATTAGTQNASVVIGSNDPARPTVTIPLTATGVAASPATQTLKVDDGSFEQTLGVGGAATVAFANRLTPPRYPATLKEIQIYFPAFEKALKTGDTFTVLVGAVSNSAADLSNASLELYTGRVIGTEAWNVYVLPDKVYPSGDILVGFSVTAASDRYPMALDTTPPSQKRSWVGGEGLAWRLFDSVSGVGGNFAIRATVALP